MPKGLSSGVPESMKQNTMAATAETKTQMKSSSEADGVEGSVDGDDKDSVGTGAWDSVEVDAVEAETRGAVGVGDWVPENVEAGMGLLVDMGAGDVEGDALGSGQGVQDGVEMEWLAGAGALVAAGVGVLAGMDDEVLEASGKEALVGVALGGVAVVGEKNSVGLGEGVMVRAGEVVLVGVFLFDSGTVNGVVGDDSEVLQAMMADDSKVLEADAGDVTGLVGSQVGDSAGAEQVTPEQSSGLLLPTSRQQQAQNPEHLYSIPHGQQSTLLPQVRLSQPARVHAAHSRCFVRKNIVRCMH